MIKARSIAPPLPETGSAIEPEISASIPPTPEPTGDDGFCVASHDILFAEASETRCDACGASLGRDDDGDEEEDRVAGHGMYLWARGTDVIREHAPLCASCACAIGMTALARWEIEEEEG